MSGYKICRGCGESKSATTEFFFGNGQGFLSARCKPCHSAAVQSRKTPEQAKRWRANTAVANRARSKAWRQAHPEEAARQARDKRAKNPEVYRAIWRKGYYADIEKSRLKAIDIQGRRRARIRSQTVGIIDFNVLAIWYGRTCYLCGDEIPAGDLHWDHIIPLAKGGEHSMNNIAPTHARCNQRKSDHVDDPYQLAVAPHVLGHRHDCPHLRDSPIHRA